MAESHNDDAGQRTIDATDVGAVPTVTEHSRNSEGLRLHTIDGSEESDIQLFSDGRSAKMLGER